MLTGAFVRCRQGGTLAELLVAMVLAGIVLGTATGSVLRQQRTAARVANVVGADAQLRAATAILPSELMFLDVSRGDLVAGEARDSALQFRAAVASSIACADGAGVVTMAPEAAGVAGVSGGASPPRAGDSLWWRADSTWRSARIDAVAATSVVCGAGLNLAGRATRLALDRTDSIMAGTPLRLTRGVRYALYRSSDGSWQLGFREWSAATGRFAAPQPVAGPFVIRSGARRSLFRYFDGAGMELPLSSGSADVSRVARVRLVVLSIAATRDHGQDSIRVDSADASLQGSYAP